LTERKNICRITSHNPPIPLEKTEFVTYSLPIPALSPAEDIWLKSALEGKRGGSLITARNLPLNEMLRRKYALN